jgi:CheY-like chemotaxis protein
MHRMTDAPSTRARPLRRTDRAGRTRAIPSAPAEQYRVNDTAARSGSEMRVLLVEDDPDIAASVHDGLRRRGFEVDTVDTGHAAIARAGDADVVLLDLGLPDIDGIDVCRELRGRSDVPIIVVSARDDELDRVVGLEVGADDYVVSRSGCGSSSHASGRSAGAAPTPRTAHTTTRCAWATSSSTPVPGV